MADTPQSPSTSTWAKAREASHQMILQAAMEDLESKAASQERQLHDTKSKVEEYETRIATVKTQNEQLQVSLEEKTQKLQSLESNHQATASKYQSLEETSKSTGERMDRLEAEGDNLREEIGRLNKSNQDYKERLVEIETQAKLGDSEVVPLRYQVQRLTSEVDAISSHSQWLEAELNSKNEQVAALRATHASDLAQLRSDFDGAVEEKESLNGQTVNLRRQLEQNQSQMERLSRELRESRREASDNSSALEQELVSTQRVAALQKDQMDRLRQKHDSMASQLEAQQKHALEAERETTKELQVRQKDLELRTKQILQEQTEDYQRQLVGVQEQLDQANRRYKQAEDGILLTNAPSRRSTTPTKPLAIRDGGDGEDDGPLNLTELYGRLAEKEDELASETLRRKKAEIRCSRIQAEVEATAPLLIRQREEYELAMTRQEEYKERMDGALRESRATREESTDLQVEFGRLQKRNKELEEETTEMAKQVQTLLVSRGTAPGSNEFSEVPTTVVEMQTANQRLLKEHRRLTSTIAELEAKLQQDTLRTKVESYERELLQLREDRKRQEVMVESIVQQRDLYRALLAKQDSNLLGSPSDEASALQIVKQQSVRTKSLEQQKNQLETDLAKSRAEIAVVDRDKEAAGERLARYEALNAELTSAVDRLQMQMSSSKGDVARSEADGTFHREKSVRLEESLQRARDEVSHSSASKNEMQRINAALQTAVSKANAATSLLESQLQQVQMKLRLAETQSETAKAAEQRMTQESSQLRHEISRQGALIDSIHRIETSLSAKSAAEEESSKNQLVSLTERLTSSGTKHSTDLETLNGKLSDQEVQIKELEQTREAAAKEALGAKKESLTAATELQQLTQKCSLLESQLRTAKKKLGETGDEHDVEAELQSKVTSLNEDLEASRKASETLKQRAVTYQKLAKDSESTLAEMTEATNAYKKSQEEELENLKSQLDVVQTETTKRTDIITELTNDLASQRGERSKELAEINQKVSEVQADAEKYQQDKDAAESRYTQLASEVVVLRAEVSTAQNNYERELGLHSTARTALRAAREEAEVEIRLRKAAVEQAANSKSELDEQGSLLEQEKSALESNLKEYEKNLEETRVQNALLHGQLEKIGDQIEKIQSGKAVDLTEGTTSDEGADFSSLTNTVSELREVVKFVRSEKTLIQAQLDTARRAAERERAVAVVTKRSLDEARAELKVFQESSQGAVAGAASDIEGLKEKLRAAEEQSKLMGESNAHLREEMRKLEISVSSLKSELEATISAHQPTEKRQQKLEGEKAGMLAEKESLLREINDWKGRVQSLVSKFNQIDPMEYAKVVQKVETLEKDVMALETKKKEAEVESKRIRALASRASKELMQNKNLVETHKKAIAKLTSEKEALATAQKDTASKKDLEEMKEKVVKLEKERASEKIQLSGATTMNDKLRERLRQFQKMITEFRKKETTTSSQLKEAQLLLEKQQKESASKTLPSEDKKESPSVSPAAATPEESTKAITIEVSEMDTIEERGGLSEDKVDAPASEVAKETPAPEKKPAKVMPKVPSGGFKFGPSAVVPSSSPKESPAKKPTPTAFQKPAPAATSKPLPAVSKKRPAEATEETSESKKRPAPEIKVEKSAETGQSAGEQEEKQTSQNSAEPPKPAVSRRMSGENKESSIKQKLLEKKRKLALAMEKVKEKKLKEMKAKSAAPDKAEEPVAKKTKIAEAPAETKEEAPAISAVPIDDAAEGITTPAISKDEDDDEEEGEIEDSKADLVAGKASQEEQSATVTTPKPVPVPASSSAPYNPFATSVGLSKPPFSSTGFGSVASAGSSVFAQAAATVVAKAPAFGQASTSFGSGTGKSPTGFGSGGQASPAFGSGTGFGAAMPGGASVFGKKPEASTGGSFGGAFLNIKPPGSSAAPPQFTFGSSGSITLPTPANPSPQATMFSAFSTQTPFNSGAVTHKPLFGSKKEEAKKEEETGGLEQPPDV